MGGEKMKAPQNFFDEAAKGRRYAPKALFDHLEKWLTMPEADLKKVGKLFLKNITTYVVRNFQGRRKGGVPVGKLDQFCVSGEVNLFDTLAAMLVSILRRRGVKELAEKNRNEAVIVLAKAFDKAAKIK